MKMLHEGKSFFRNHVQVQGGAGRRERGRCGRSYEEQARGIITKALSPIDGFPTGCTSLAEDVSLMPDAFHSRSRLVKVSKIVMTSEPPGEVLALGQVVRHAPGDINREDDALIGFPGGQLLNQLDNVRDRGRNLVNTCYEIDQHAGSLKQTVPPGKRDKPGLGSLNVV